MAFGRVSFYQKHHADNVVSDFELSGGYLHVVAPIIGSCYHSVTTHVEGLISLAILHATANCGRSQQSNACPTFVGLLLDDRNGSLANGL